MNMLENLLFSKWIYNIKFHTTVKNEFYTKKKS
jgi:hypothetical protein